MKVLVDTSIWSLAFRKKARTLEARKIVDSLTELARDLKIVMIGPIRQEILSGIADPNKYLELREKLSVLADHPITTNDYETAARFFNECRKNGVQGSHIDFLICAVAGNNDFAIFTLDKDFLNYRRYLPISLYNLSRQEGKE